MKQQMKQQLLFFRWLQVFVVIFGLMSQTMAQTPGGVSTNLRVWFKANDGPNTTTEGGAVSSWADKSGLGFNIGQTSATLQPKYHAKAMNFNPVVRFSLNSIGNLLSNSILPATTNPVSIVAMSICNRSTSGYNTIVSFGGALDYPSDQIYNGTFRTYVDGTAPIFSDHPDPMAFKHTITYSTHANLAGSAGKRQLGFNGLGNMQTPTLTNGDFPAGGVSDHFSLGAEKANNTVEDFLGDIPEVIVYNKVLTNAELQKIQSYLAVKYGVTMDNLTDYHSSAGSIMWAKSTTYGNNVFGIAKDDGSGLDQRVSKSINTGTILTIATNKDFVSANNDASRTSLNNGQSLMIGDNGTDPSLYSTFTSNCVGVAGSVRLNTVWQASNVNTVGSVLFNVNLSGSGINDEPFMLIGNSAAFGDGTYRFVKGIINADGTATFAAKLNHGEFFTFGGVRATGICPTCANGSGAIEWNKAPFWPIPTLTNTAVTKTIGGTGQSVNIIFNDPQGVEYAKRVRPIRYGKTLLLDRRDNFTPTGTPNGGAYTGVFTFDKAALAKFSIHAIDRWNINCKDIVEIKGYCGAKTISPKLSYTLPANQSSYVISGNTATGNKLWSGYFAKRGMLKVEFDTPVEKIEIIWKTTKVGTIRRFQRIGISNMAFDCPDADPCLVNDDNITFVKKISDNVSEKVTCENITFEYKLKNNTCVDKIVNINDILPAGMQWITDGFDGGASGGTTNSYAGTATLTASGISVPAGQGVSVFATAKFTNTSAASYSNRATMTVNGGVAGTISSGCGNTNWTTIAGTPPPVPAITHTVNKTCYNKNEVLTYTVTLNNTSGAPITGAVFETALQDEFGMIDASVSNTLGGTVTLDEGETSYGGMENLEITGMTVPIGISTFTYQVNSGVSDSTFVMYASVSADPNTDCATEAMQTATGITMSLCAACSAGSTAPIITQTAVSNTCPAITVNLATMTNTGSAPSGSKLVWSTKKVPTTLSDTLTNLNVSGGKYYALYVDKTNSCFSTNADSVTVTINICFSTPPTKSPAPGGNENGNGGTELDPKGGTEPYNYSNGSSDPLCVAPVGYSPLPATSNFTITNATTGAYSYTAPTTPGNYYFCIKVCDNSTPQKCTVAVYKVEVGATNGLVTVKVLLQGPLSGTTMSTTLNSNNLIPTTDPYSNGKTTTATILSTNSITDWVMLELRSAPGTVTETVAVLLKNDGTLLNADGTSPVKFTTGSGNYYVSVRHRNHLGVMTANPIAISTTATSIDFTLSSTATYGNTATTPSQKMEGSVLALWGGNAAGINSTTPENVRMTTLTSDIAAVTNKITTVGGGTAQVLGYNSTDVNMDGTTRQSTLASDKLLIRNNIVTHPGNASGAKTYIIQQTF